MGSCAAPSAKGDDKFITTDYLQQCLKIYHRTHPDAPAFARNELEGVGDGDPVDIPRDQFVSVRVEMPADSLYNQKISAAEQAMTADAGE
ncbi:hypothetical protein [Enterobacter hormaechei]|uniref:phage tail fiber protein n=1 Tax=Enterobacter hormaechei TaxID=158836 RepID=UPI00387EA711